MENINWQIEVEDVAMALNVNLDEPVIPADKFNSLIPQDEFSTSTQSLVIY